MSLRGARSRTPSSPSSPPADAGRAEFRTFVAQAERQLFSLFEAIYKDGNAKLDVAELQSAFRAAGLSVSNRRLSDFFHDMDKNNDGFVSFDEWRYVSTFLSVAPVFAAPPPSCRSVA